MTRGRLQYGWMYILALAIGLTIWPGSDAHALNTNVIEFTVNIVLGTNKVEDAEGTVVFAASDLAVSTVIPLDLAQAIANDPVVPTAFQQSIGSLAGTTDYSFLIALGGGPVELLDHTGNVGSFSDDVFTVVSNDLASVSILGAVLKSESITPVASSGYQINAIDPITSVQVVGWIDVDYYKVCMLEQVPEPATWVMVVVGAAGLMLAAAKARRPKPAVVPVKVRKS